MRDSLFNPTEEYKTGVAWSLVSEPRPFFSSYC